MLTAVPCEQVRMFHGKEDIRTFWVWKSYKKNIELYQNFIGFYRKGADVLDELQNP